MERNCKAQNRLWLRAEARVRLKRHKGDDFEQPSLTDRQACKCRFDVGECRRFPQDGRACQVATLPYLAQGPSDVKRADAGGFGGHQFRGKGGGVVENAAAERQKLHRVSLRPRNAM
uniref:Uncharacterized protein n=1 Tax=mine drainage metagenome TaxID=410659 RepID=E6QNZ4_9ZZZZ